MLAPLERVDGVPLYILDLGAGNGWLSNRLAMRGHQVAAVDLTTNDFDGLGCFRHYETTFMPVQADFDYLPFMNCSVDLVLFDASLHYATCYEKTFHELLRVLNPGGRLVIIDTPFYEDKASGEKMVKERQIGSWQNMVFHRMQWPVKITSRTDVLHELLKTLIWITKF